MANLKSIPYVNSIFQQPWWLDAVAPDCWDVIEIKVADEVRARMPYILNRGPLGLRLCVMPPLTPFLGPWLAPSTAKYAKQLAYQKDLMTAIIDQIPPNDIFRLSLHYSITNWLPFYWKGFSATTRYTYVLEDLSDMERIWDGFQMNIRGDIRKAKRKLVVRNDLDLEKFMGIIALTFKRQLQAPPYSWDLVKRIDTACMDRGVRKIFFAEDSQGKIHAAIYVIWDESSAYLLMSGGDPELRNSGATSLLIWEAINFACSVTNKFDFEGSVIEPIERFFRAFGAVQKSYFLLTKLSRYGTVLVAARDMLRAFHFKKIDDIISKKI